jgi:oligoribonuclease
MIPASPSTPRKQVDQYYPEGLLFPFNHVAPIKLMWLDFETTGLNSLSDEVTEVAVRFTNEQGIPPIYIYGFDAPVEQPPEVLDRADPWVKKHGEKLLENSRFHSGRINYDELDKLLSAWLLYFGSTEKNPSIHLAGNSVWYDRNFMLRNLPKTMKLLHYRQLDLSSVRLFLEGCLPEVKEQFAFAKREIHRSVEDVRDSLTQFELYRVFVRGLLARAGLLPQSSPEDIREKGWSVAVHNDYKQDGKNHTFWLFTKGIYHVKGEGETDAQALEIVRKAIAVLERQEDLN